MAWIATADIYVETAEYVETRFDTSIYKLQIDQDPEGKIKKVIGLMKDELRRDMMTKFIASRRKTYAYLRDDGNENKKANNNNKKGYNKTRT